MADWDTRITEVVGMTANQERNLNLICHFNPEHLGNVVGFFWIASLLTRVEFEDLDEKLNILQPFDLGFRIGDQVFLPKGNTQGRSQIIVLWPNHEK